MSNVRVSVGPQPSTNVKVFRPSSSVSVAEDRVSVEITDPKLAVSVIEGFMAIFRLGDLIDVDVTALEDGCVLVYNSSTAKWVATRVLEKQYVNAGQF